MIFFNPLNTIKKIIPKIRLHLSSAANFRYHYVTKLNIETNSVNPDQTDPIGAVWSESSLFVGNASNSFQQTTKAEKILLWLAH